MDALELVAIDRAHAALSLVIGNRDADHRAQAKAFQELAWVMLRAERGTAFAALKACDNHLVQKAAAHAYSDAEWEGDAAALAASYLASVAEFSILDQIKKFASVLPTQARRVMVAVGATGDEVAEGFPKAIRKLQLTTGDAEPTKAVSIIVLTKELALATGDAGRRLFERELEQAVVRASNASVLAALENSSTIAVPGTDDPLVDLRAGLRAAGPSEGYIIAAASGDVADLATSEANRGGMGVRGGTFVPGVEIVAVDDLTGMIIVPASRLALWDSGLQVRSAEHASVDMANTPASPAEMVNLWQTNSLGLIAERHWHLAQATEIVVVGGGS